MCVSIQCLLSCSVHRFKLQKLNDSKDLVIIYLKYSLRKHFFTYRFISIRIDWPSKFITRLYSYKKNIYMYISKSKMMSYIIILRLLLHWSFEIYTRSGLVVTLALLLSNWYRYIFKMNLLYLHKYRICYA